VSAARRKRPARRSRDEDPLESPFEDDDAVERCWGYEMPVRHRPAPRREPLP
jgi:hypothetical protein